MQSKTKVKNYCFFSAIKNGRVEEKKIWKNKEEMKQSDTQEKHKSSAKKEQIYHKAHTHTK